MNFRYRELTYD